MVALVKKYLNDGFMFQYEEVNIVPIAELVLIFGRYWKKQVIGRRN